MNERAPRFHLVRSATGPLAAPDLDAHQRRVIDHPGGPLLVLAGPGTGKTATLVEAVVDRIANRNVDPESVLILTFGRKAAVELRERVTGRLGRTTREPLARTFHSYAFGLLRRDATARGEPPPRLLSGPEQDLVIRELLRGDAAGEGTVDWPAALRPALLTRGFAGELRDLLSRAVERGLGPADLDRYGRQLRRDDWRAAARFLRQYLDVTALAGGGIAYDPAELIRAALDTLRADPDLLAAERAARRHVFVDEYQDTDPAQAELLATLAAGATELVVVGDPDQSIYAFRGADPDGLRRFTEDFRPPGGGEVPVVALTTTRRCGAVLAAAGRRIAARLPGPVAHRALEPAPDTEPGTAEVRLLRSTSAEAAYIAHRLRVAHLRDGVPWRDMAVLVRSATAALPVLRRAMTTAGVPLTLAGADIPLVDQPGVAPIVLLMRCALRPDTLDEDTAATLLCSPLGGADTLGLRRLRRYLRRLEAAAGERTGAPLADALSDPAGLTALPEEVAGPATRIAELIGTARKAAAEPAATAEDVAWAVWSASGLAEDWSATSLRGGPAGAAADRDLDAVVALFDAAARFTDRLPRSGPGVFVDHLLDQRVPGDSLAARAPDGDAVRVLTAHAAKGLQWGFVVVAGVQEGTWPDLRRRGTLLGSEILVDLAAGRDPEPLAPTAPILAEERRLFYVACTRARRTLLVTAVRGEDQQPSRFLDEIDPPADDTPRPVTPVPRTLSLPALVAELRAAVCDPGKDERRRRAAATQLARLADVPGAHPADWWGLAPLSDDRPLRGPGEVVTVSPSAVETFATCELRWLAETVGGTPGRAAGQTIGTLVHDLAALAGEPDPAIAESLTARLDDALDDLDLGGAWHSRRERERAHTLLAKFLDWLSASRARLDLIGTEIGFRVPVGEHAQVRGRVDRLERDTDGRPVVVDLKTGRAAPTQSEVDAHAQLGVYQLAVSLGAFTAAGAGTEPGGAALVQLGGNTVGPKEQRQSPLADAPDPDWARTLVERAGRGMAGAVFEARPNTSCRTCPARASCPAHPDGRQVGA